MVRAGPTLRPPGAYGWQASLPAARPRLTNYLKCSRLTPERGGCMTERYDRLWSMRFRAGMAALHAGLVSPPSLARS